MIKVPKLNERLIAKVVKHIEKFPQSYNQNVVGKSVEKTKERPCGAIGCFGGWAMLLSMPKSQRQTEAPEVALYDAMEKLGLTSDESDYLFNEATGDPKKDLKIIKYRLEVIFNARKALKKVRGKEENFHFPVRSDDKDYACMATLDY